MQPKVVAKGAAPMHPLGKMSFTILAETKDNEGAFSLLEFGGEEGPWTVPHIHRSMEESFYVLDGRFVFTVGDSEVEAPAGTYVLVPRGVQHVFRAVTVGRLLCLAVPAGLEEMFRELSKLPADSITDPEARARISAKYDSIPVAAGG